MDTNKALGVFFPSAAFKGVLGVFPVLMSSSGSDHVAIHEGHQEKLDFAWKLGKRGRGYPLAGCLTLPRHWNQSHPRLNHFHYTVTVGFLFHIHLKCSDVMMINTLEMPIEEDEINRKWPGLLDQTPMS